MDNLNQQISVLSPEKRVLLENWLKEKAARTQPGQSIPKLQRSEPLLLSFSQQRMWFVDQLEPGNPAYNRPTHFRLTGELKVDVLTHSLNEIVRRHAILRSRFPSVKGEPTVEIAAALTLSLPIVDLRDLPVPTQTEQVQQIAAQAAQKPFDLARGPLLRSTVAQAQ